MQNEIFTKNTIFESTVFSQKPNFVERERELL